MSSISINQLPRIEEVNTGDLFLIQTPSSSNTLDFKNLIIGLENTTFANTISTFNTNIEILSADVGSLSAKVDTNTADIVIANDNISANTLSIDINTTDIATNTTDIATNVTSIEDISDSVDDLKALNYPTLTPALGVGQSTHTLPITINGVSYVILLSATS